jgi:hypothetical protein
LWFDSRNAAVDSKRRGSNKNNKRFQANSAKTAQIKRKRGQVKMGFVQAIYGISASRKTENSTEDEYTIQFNCQNCGKRYYLDIPKGKPAIEHDQACDKCGCKITTGQELCQSAEGE